MTLHTLFKSMASSLNSLKNIRKLKPKNNTKKLMSTKS